ncbi:MAG: FecR domain-containing protein [Thermoanaerobaculia bacterium]
MTEHTSNNSSNDSKVASLTDDVGRLVRMAGPRATMPSARLDRMQAELRPLWEEQVEQPSPGRPRLRFAAAAVLAVALAAAFFGRALLFEEATRFASVARLTGSASVWRGTKAGSAESLDSGTELETGNSIATAVGSLLALETVTGHSLRLDQATRVVLASDHEVRLEQGAIYLESGIEHGGDRLTILTPFGRVEEIGTQFEVRLGSDTLTVRVREGEVELGTSTSVARAVAGEEITLSSGAVHRASLASYDPVFEWTQRIAPTWPLDGSRLEGFLDWAARQSGHRLEYSEQGIEEEAGGVVLSGEIEGLSPSEALEAVLPAVGLAHRYEEGVLLVSRLGDPSDPKTR